MISPPPRTQEESENLINRLDALTYGADRDAVKRIRTYQQEHRIYMQQTYGKFMDQFETFFSAVVAYARNINYLDKKAWPINRGFQFVIATRSLKQLYSSYDLLCDGSYEDSIALIRSVYESFLRIIFVSCHPECPYNAYGAPGQTGAKFKVTNFVKNELKLNWNTYSVTSVFTHSNMYIVMGDMINLSKKPTEIVLTYQKNDDQIGLTINLINFMVTILLDVYDQLFVVDISKHKQKTLIQSHIDKLHEYASISHEALSGHDASEYWRKTAVDIEHIFILIKGMDSDPSQDWKRVWRSIRQST